MNNIYDVYRKLCENYKEFKITIEEGIITVYMGKYRIEAYDETINFMQNNKCITHTHSNYDFEVMYKKIVMYINKREILRKEIVLDKIKFWLIFLILCIIVTIIKESLEK